MVLHFGLCMIVLTGRRFLTVCGRMSDRTRLRKYNSVGQKRAPQDISRLSRKNPALQDSPPAAGRASDIFHSAAVRSSRSFFAVFLQNHCLAVLPSSSPSARRRQPFSILQPVENLAKYALSRYSGTGPQTAALPAREVSPHNLHRFRNPYGITPRIHFATSLLWH